MSESEKVEEKYKPFWHTEPEVKDVVEPKVVTESKPVDPPKESFFDNTIGEIFHRKNPKPKNLKSKVKVKYESKSSYNSNSPFIRLVTGAITIGVVVGVGYMVLSQVMSVPEVQQEMNTTMIGGSSATSLIMPAFTIVAVGIVVMAAFGLLNVFKSGEA